MITVLGTEEGSQLKLAIIFYKHTLLVFAQVLVQEIKGIILSSQSIPKLDNVRTQILKRESR